MKKVMMSKYGFVRWPEKDFSDDGNRFTCYRAGKAVRVSKLVTDGDAYLSIDSSVGKGTLPYEVYSTLPNYQKANWGYNGISLANLTDEDLKDFYDACIAYEKEYEEAEANIVYPTLEEITKQCEKIKAKRLDELTKVRQLMAIHSIEAAQKLGNYDWRQIQQYIKDLSAKVSQYDPKTMPVKIHQTSTSFNFVKPDYSELEDCFYYTYIVECLTTKIGIAK